MGRTAKALNKLRAKCTKAGMTPKGDSVADLLDCIAEHFEVLPEHKATDSGKVLSVKADGSLEWKALE